MKPRVFIVQDCPGKNVLPAEQFGDLRTLIGRGRLVGHANLQIEELQRRLVDYNDNDYILPIGDPSAIGLCCAIAAKNNDGKFKMLNWNGAENRYYVVTAEI